jgi:hypothetical protein
MEKQHDIPDISTDPPSEAPNTATLLRIDMAQDEGEPSVASTAATGEQAATIAAQLTELNSQVGKVVKWAERHIKKEGLEEVLDSDDDSDGLPEFTSKKENGDSNDSGINEIVSGLSSDSEDEDISMDASNYKKEIYYRQKIDSKNEYKTSKRTNLKNIKPLRVGAMVMGKEVEVYPITVTQRFFKGSKRSSKMTYSGLMIRIESEHIMDALHDVVEYYPSVDLAVRRLKINQPFLVVMYHFNQLKKYANTPGLDPTAAVHINLLLELVGKLRGKDLPMLERVTAGEVRSAQFNDLWMFFRPGTVIVNKLAKRDEKAQPEGLALPRAYVVSSIHFVPGLFMKIWYWCMDFDGFEYGRSLLKADTISVYQGERQLSELEMYPLSLDENPEKLRKGLVERGRKFMSLRKSFKHYDGPVWSSTTKVRYLFASRRGQPAKFFSFLSRSTFFRLAAILYGLP